MNNYPNYVGQRFPTMMPQMNYQPMAQMPQMQVPPVQQMPQMVEPAINYDFYGVQIKSFEEAQKYPYCCEKPLFLLDAQNEKVYIKKLDQNGIPSVVTYEMKEIKENATQKEEKNVEVQTPQFDFSAELQKIRQELKEDMQKQIQELKTTHENENKGNKKW